MKKIYILLLLLLYAFSWHHAHAITIYVAPSGKDTNPGTMAQPFASLAAARDHVRLLRNSREISGPVEIFISGGTYYLEQPVVFTHEDSGTEDAPLIIRAHADDIPVFSGATRLAPFEKASGNLWKTRIPEIQQYGGSVQQLFVNGKRAVRARTPDYGRFFRTKDASEMLADTAGGGSARLAVHTLHLTSGQVHALQSAGPDLQNTIVSVHHAWDRTRKYIAGASFRDSAVYITGRPAHSWNKLNNSSQFIFENAKAFLSAPGEWFVDREGILFYVPREGETIENTTAVTPVIDHFMLIRGTADQKVEHIRFENLSFQYSRYTMSFRGNEPAQAANNTAAAIMLDHAKDIRFQNCEIAHTGTSAIWFRTACSDSRVRHCYLHDLGVGGVKIGERRLPSREGLVTKNITVDNNIIRSGGHEFPTGVGIILFHASDNVISHNEIADFRYSGISAGWVWGYKDSPAKRNKILFNHIHHLGWGVLSDMGGVYLLGPSEGTVVRNNVIHDIYSYGYGGWGIYTDEGSSGIIIENNLVYNCKSAAFHQHYGKENIIRNNIFSSQLKAQLEATRVEDHRSFSFTNNIVYFDRGVLTDKPGWGTVNFFADNNLYWDPRIHDVRFSGLTLKEWQAATGKDKHSVVADPLFADPSRHNFHFTSTSAIDAIQFKPFDYEKAGVYGEDDWIRRASFDKGRAEDFDKMVEERLQESEPAINN